MNRKIKICYIGGGSKQWARVFMSDLALTEGLYGEMALYDIDDCAVERNVRIGNSIKSDEKVISHFDYNWYKNVEDALSGANFVIMSILPGTFKEMRVDVHAPEKFGLYQPVGDTVGPGGVLRAMRTVPIYEYYARLIAKICPDAFVINYTNPMSICTKTLYDVFPKIKAFGCCHEVFHAQEFLTCALKEIKGIIADRTEIYTDACGVNHFTWITEARYKNIDLIDLLPDFIEKFYDEGYFERGNDRFAFKYDLFAYGNKVKMDLFKKYGVLAAAGDRHLVEFLPADWYVKNPEAVKYWQYNLTDVAFREKRQAEQIEETIMMADGLKKFPLVKSDEEGVKIMKALLGEGQVITNVNMPNIGQMPEMPSGAIVETNCIFTNGFIRPVVSKPLPTAVNYLVYRNLSNIETTYEGIKERNLEKIFRAFVNQPLCDGLDAFDAKQLFKEMCIGTRKYLDDYYNLDDLYKI